MRPSLLLATEPSAAGTVSVEHPQVQFGIRQYVHLELRADQRDANGDHAGASVLRQEANDLRAKVRRLLLVPGADVPQVDGARHLHERLVERIQIAVE